MDPRLASPTGEMYGLQQLFQSLQAAPEWGAQNQPWGQNSNQFEYPMQFLRPPGPIPDYYTMGILPGTAPPSNRGLASFLGNI